MASATAALLELDNRSGERAEQHDS